MYSSSALNINIHLDFEQEGEERLRFKKDGSPLLTVVQTIENNTSPCYINDSLQAKVNIMCESDEENKRYYQKNLTTSLDLKYDIFKRCHYL